MKFRPGDKVCTLRGNVVAIGEMVKDVAGSIYTHFYDSKGIHLGYYRDADLDLMKPGLDSFKFKIGDIVGPYRIMGVSNIASRGKSKYRVGRLSGSEGPIWTSEELLQLSARGQYKEEIRKELRDTPGVHPETITSPPLTPAGSFIKDDSRVWQTGTATVKVTFKSTQELPTRRKRQAPVFTKVQSSL